MVTYLSTKGKLIYRDENGNDFHEFPSIGTSHQILEILKLFIGPEVFPLIFYFDSH